MKLPVVHPVSLALLICLLASFASDVEVLDASVAKTSNTWQFDVTLRHDDSGWEHYANKWEIRSPEGELLATRVYYCTPM